MKGGPTHLPHLKERVRKGSTIFDRWDFMIPSFILKVRKASLCHWRWTTSMFSPRWGYPQLKGPVLMLKLPFFLNKQVDTMEGCLVVSVISWGRRDSRGREGVGEAQQRDKTTTNHMCTLQKSYTCTSSNLLWLNHCRRNGSWKKLIVDIVWTMLVALSQICVLPSWWYRYVLAHYVVVMNLHVFFTRGINNKYLQ